MYIYIYIHIHIYIYIYNDYYGPVHAQGLELGRARDLQDLLGLNR